MNFTTNHDENSWGGTVFERLGLGSKTFSALTYFLPGMPLLYNGQEYGLNKRLEFFSKDYIEKSDNDFFNFYKNLAQIKKSNKALNIEEGVNLEIIETGNTSDILLKNDCSNDMVTNRTGTYLIKLCKNNNLIIFLR